MAPMALPMENWAEALMLQTTGQGRGSANGGAHGLTDFDLGRRQALREWTAKELAALADLDDEQLREKETKLNDWWAWASIERGEDWQRWELRARALDNALLTEWLRRYPQGEDRSDLDPEVA